MAYDYHFYVWYYPVTGLNAPLYPTTGFANTFSVNYSANYWLAKGMPREKLIIGIPTYGHSYELDNPRNHDLLAPAKGFGKLGNFGFTSYYDACTFLANGAIRQYNRESRVPYAYKDSEWLSYDDRVSVLQKVNLQINIKKFNILRNWNIFQIKQFGNVNNLVNLTSCEISNFAKLTIFEI